MEQQHLAAFAAGRSGLPGMRDGDRRAALLREMQTSLCATSQVWRDSGRSNLPFVFCLMPVFLLTCVVLHHGFRISRKAISPWLMWRQCSQLVL